ncbi:MAG: NAD(P)/FAD-dependent oxidoreductase [Natronospirillum sp.]
MVIRGSYVQEVDVLIIGAGAAGLMCAITAGQRGRSVVVLDHANKPGKKILMSGGGRCNFTNLVIEPDNFLSQNPHFCKSALSRYTQWDFISLVAAHGIPYHEKDSGQLFCDRSSKDILDMLLHEAQQAGVVLSLNTSVKHPRYQDGHWEIKTSAGNFSAESVVVATGGPPIPTMGATDWGQKFAASVGHNIVPYRASLVPYTADPAAKQAWSELPGVSLPVELTVNARSWSGDILFTHRGLSGPAVLQITNYWREGEAVTIDWWPGHDLVAEWLNVRQTHGRQLLKSWLSDQLPKRVVAWLVSGWSGEGTAMADLSQDVVLELAQRVHAFRFQPSGTEGYRTAEVTLGGVSTDKISSRTMESTLHPGLYFIGEVLDVTGHLGGYNFQWAWSSGHAAGTAV